MGPEEIKFTNWFNEEKKKGLVDLKVTKNPFSTTTLDRETICKELNAMNDAIANGDYHILTPKDFGGE